MKLIQNLWTDLETNLMTKMPLQDLLERTSRDFSHADISNKYALVHTEVTNLSFFQNVRNVQALVNCHNWYIKPELSLGDDRTMIKLLSCHTRHTVTVLMPGSTTKMVTVQCREPQTIYDLMKKHDISCSTMWNQRISLSARAPCTTLSDHNMAVVYVNTIPYTNTFGQDADEQCQFYHNMKYIHV
ncbi:hypothetical protein UPYG_G00353140 [Umbra pygmaea]|uniref:Uncharacterized protein n=1 Tax=Umbra pygmaea TaxID=75934 RepID=A0ABD0W9I7_UMBPY